MKLLFCPMCDDVIKLVKEMRHCSCKQSSGIVIVQKDSSEVAQINSCGIPFALDSVRLGYAFSRWLLDKRTIFVHGWTIDPTDQKNDCSIIGEGV